MRFLSAPGRIWRPGLGTSACMADSRRRRATAMTLVVLLVAVAAWLAGCSHGAASRGGTASHQAGAHLKAAPLSLAAAESGLLPWHMPEPLSREVVITGSPGQLIVFGGLTAAGTSAGGIYSVSTAAGTARRIGTLSAPLHDAAAAVSGHQALIFGGASPVTVGTVQSFPLAGRGAAPHVGSLPEPRSDAQAVTMGTMTYLVGGYDGSRPDASVLATTDGRSYSTVATLPVPVRYPAVAALGGRIYAFGGQAVTGPHAGEPVNVIQAVDPAHRTAAIIGHLPSRWRVQRPSPWTGNCLLLAERAPPPRNPPPASAQRS